MEVKEPNAKYLAKAGYEQTEVGVIPRDWLVVSATDACVKIQDGTHFSPKTGGTDYLYVTSKNIRFGYLDLSNADSIDAVQHEAIYRRCDVKPNDLLLTKDGANTGNAALNTVQEEFSLLSSVAFLRFMPDKYSAGYFLQQILSHSGQRQIQDAMSGNAITRLTLEKIRNLRFPVPPNLAEQQAIAEALCDADALIESLEQLLAKKRQIKQGAMQELLTGQKRLPGFTEDWRRVALGDWGNCYRGVSYNPASDLYPFDTENTVRLLRSNNVQDSCIVLSDMQYVDMGRVSDDQRLRSSDVLICMANGSRDLVGKAGKFAADDGFEYTFGAFMGCFRPDAQQVNADFVFYVFQSEAYRRHIAILLAGSSINNLTPGGVESFVTPVPVDKDEQTAIASILSDMDAEIAALEAKLAKARQIKQGMMDELLTGRIRLV